MQRLNHFPNRPAARAQRGVSMVELLVALVIFAFGMLGMAGLQTRALQYGQSSLHRSQATALADDLLDRLRTDRGNALAGQWNSDFTDSSTSSATADMNDWKSGVEALLPSGAAEVKVSANGDVTVKIQWDESRISSAESTLSLTTQSRL